MWSLKNNLAKIAAKDLLAWWGMSAVGIEEGILQWQVQQASFLLPQLIVIVNNCHTDTVEVHDCLEYLCILQH